MNFSTRSFATFLHPAVSLSLASCFWSDKREAVAENRLEEPPLLTEINFRWPETTPARQGTMSGVFLPSTTLQFLCFKNSFFTPPLSPSVIPLSFLSPPFSYHVESTSSAFHVGFSNFKRCSTTVFLKICDGFA